MILTHAQLRDSLVPGAAALVVKQTGERWVGDVMRRLGAPAALNGRAVAVRLPSGHVALLSGWPRADVGEIGRHEDLT